MTRSGDGSKVNLGTGRSAAADGDGRSATAGGDGSSAVVDGAVALDRETAESYAIWFQALSDPTRIIILSYLSRRREPVPVGQIVNDLGLGQSTVSHHLKILREVGFVTRTRDRTARLYAVDQNRVTKFPTAADVVMGRAPSTMDRI